MQIVINIPEEDYNFVKKQVADGITNPLKIRIANGIPIPDNATNGDVIRALFKPNWIRRIDDVVREEYEFNEVWWNASYKKGGTNRKSCEYRHENGNCLKVGGFCTSVDDKHCMKGDKE